MKKKIHIIILYFIGFGININAQTKAEAEVLFNTGNYIEAKVIYEKLLKKKPKDALLNFCYAKCLYYLEDFSAKYFFDIANEKYPQGHRLMGDLYFSKYHFAEAANEYKCFLEKGNEDADLTQKLKQCTIGAEMLNHVELIYIIDSLVVNKNNFLSKYKLPNEAGFIEQTTNEKTLYMTERKDRKFFSNELNSQLDIFYSYLLLNDWSDPISISNNINTSYNESYPFMMADGITLYFASDKPEGLGGYDIYMTRFSPISNEYLPAKNIGMPFNSTANDYMFAIDETNGIGIFATDRNQNKDSVAIYQFVFNKEKEIIKTDSCAIYDYAQLKKYHKATTSKKEDSTSKSDQKTKKNTGINFIINSKITYYSLNDFKSDETRNRFLALQILKSDFDLLQTKLKTKRKEYTSVENSEKEDLSWEILALEKELLTMQKRIQTQTIELRKIENQHYK